MADLLSSASLLVAITAVLYSLWYADIARGINMPLPDFREQCDVPLTELNGIILRRAVPLSVSSVGLAVVFLKDTVRILVASVESLRLDLRRVLEYDAVSTAFVFVEFIWIYVSIQLVADFVKLLKKRRALRSQPSIND